MPIWKPAAVADRKAIAEYIARDKPLAAVELVDLVIERAGMLDNHPKAGRPGRIKGTYEWVVHPHYVVVYRLSGKPAQVEILRVLHTSQMPTV